MQKHPTQEQLTEHLVRIGGILSITIILMIAYLILMLVIATIILVNLVQ